DDLVTGVQTCALPICADESILRGKTYLIAKKSKERIMASQAEIVRGPEGKRINAIIFHFPKKNATGQTIVSADEKELKFVSRARSEERRVGKGVRSRW